MVRLNLTRPRILGIVLAAVSLAFAACSHGSSNTTPAPSASPATAAPTGTGSPNPFTSPCSLSLGQAYEPDGGNGAAFTGVQVVRFEDNNQHLCAAIPAAPASVAFASSVGTLAFSPDFSDAVALLQKPGGGYSYVQDIFGSSLGQLVPVGSPYDIDVPPSPVPSPLPSTGVTPGPTTAPSPVPLIPDGTSISILGSSSLGIAFALGPSANPPAFVGLTSLTNAPPQYGGAVTLSGTNLNYTLKTLPNYPRSIVRVASSGNVVLVRGAQDLVSFGITVSGGSYSANAQAEDATLGYGGPTTLRGSGALAYDASDATRALIGGTTAGGANVLTLVTGLPGAITKTSALTLPGAIHSLAISLNGAYAVAGTDAGIVIVGGINSSVLTIVPAFTGSANGASQPAYADCAGAARAMTAVYSVGLSAGNIPNTTNDYLVALGTAAGVNCASGYNATVVALPFNPTTGGLASPVPTASPAAGTTPAPAPPTSFTQNNVILPPPGADYLVVH